MHGKTERFRSLIQMADRRERDGKSSNEENACVAQNRGSDCRIEGAGKGRKRETVCSGNSSSSSCVKFFSHRSHRGHFTCAELNACAQNGPGKKNVPQESVLWARGRSGREDRTTFVYSYMFNPLVCRFFTIGGRLVEFVDGSGNRICVRHVRLRVISHRVPDWYVSDRDSCKSHTVYIFVYSRRQILVRAPWCVTQI